MSEPRISPRASEDLVEIWSYIADDSMANADSFIDKLYETSAQPPAWLGTSSRGAGFGDSKFSLWPIHHFLRAVNTGIEIVRVLHGARDIENIF